MKNHSKNLTEEKVQVAAVKAESKKNKLHSYLKCSANDDGGAIELVSKDASDGFYMGTHDLDLTNSTIQRVLSICAKGGKLNDSTTLIANATMAAILETDPQDSTELMLATQMALVHNMALEMSRRAMLSEQTFEGVESNVNRAIKLMRTYTTQVEALNKYRNKGKQQITVKHQNVNVNDGGQAVIGDINQGGSNG